MKRTILILFFLCGLLLPATGKATHKPATDKDSVATTYHENGKVKEKQHFRNGLKHGRWKEFNENGALIRKAKYKNGVLWWEHLYKDGRLIQTTDHKGRVHKGKACGC